MALHTRRAVLSAAAVGVGLAGCNQAGSDPTPTPTATATDQAAYTPAFTPPVVVDDELVAAHVGTVIERERGRLSPLGELPR